MLVQPGFTRPRPVVRPRAFSRRMVPLMWHQASASARGGRAWNWSSFTSASFRWVRSQDRPDLRRGTCTPLLSRECFKELVAILTQPDDLESRLLPGSQRGGGTRDPGLATFSEFHSCRS